MEPTTFAAGDRVIYDDHETGKAVPGRVCWVDEDEKIDPRNIYVALDDGSQVWACHQELTPAC